MCSLACWSLLAASALAPAEPYALEVTVDGRRLDVDLINRSAGRIRVLNQGSFWGDRQFAVLLEDPATGEPVVLRGDRGVYTKNTPSPAEIGPGGRRRFRLDLGDGTWRHEGFDVPASRPEELVVTGVIYTPDVTPTELRLGILLRRIEWRRPAAAPR